MAKTPAEQMLISSVLRNGDLPSALKHGLNERMFHIYPNEYKWIESYYLKNSRTPQKASFKLNFPNFVFKVADETEHFVEEVKHEHKLKSITAAVNEILDRTDIGDGDGALQAMHTAAMSISQDLGLINDGDIFRDNEDIIKEFQMRKERYELYGSSGIATGFETFDERTGGFSPAELWIIAARTGKGKSWSMQKFAAHAALMDNRVLYYALEQPRANVFARIASLISLKVAGQVYTAQNLIRGKDYDAAEFHRFVSDLRENIKGALNVADGTMGKVSTASIAAGIERNKPDIVFVDHITLMGKRSNDHAGVGEVADELTFMANKYGIPIVAGAQLNRAGANADAGTETIAEADKIGQDASGIVFIQNHSARVIEYKTIKYRNGSSNWSWWSKFNPDEGKFHEITYETAQDLIEEDVEEAKRDNADNE